MTPWECKIIIGQTWYCNTIITWCLPASAADIIIKILAPAEFSSAFNSQENNLLSYFPTLEGQFHFCSKFFAVPLFALFSLAFNW